MHTIILAGGKSSRMGQDKAAMEVAGQRMIERLISEFQPVSQRVIVITNRPRAYRDVQAVVREDHPEFKGEGPLAGILAGLTEAGKGPCLVVACDLPFADIHTGMKMASVLQENSAQAAVPSEGGRIHPLFAAYDAGISGTIRELLTAGNRSVRALLETVHTVYWKVEDETDAFLNMNTMEDYIKALSMLEGGEIDGK